MLSKHFEDLFIPHHRLHECLRIHQMYSHYNVILNGLWHNLDTWVTNMIDYDKNWRFVILDGRRNLLVSFLWEEKFDLEFTFYNFYLFVI